MIKKDALSNIKKPRNMAALIAAMLVLIIFFLMPTPEGLTHDGQVMIGILIMAGILWITEAVPLPVTGLLIMILQPALMVRDSKLVFESFGNQAIFFLIGAFIIAAAIEKHGLHKRIAIKFLSFFEDSPKLFTFGIMASCAFLSFIMPEHGVAALFLPIILSILIAMKIVPRQSNFGKISMLSVAYGCSIGSLGTLIGGARNPLTVGILLEHNINVSFFDWMLYAMPVVIISIPLVWLVLQISFPIEIRDISAAKNEIKNQLKTAGKISKNEFSVLCILILTIIMWILFSQPEITDTYGKYYGLAVVAIIGGLLLFFTGLLNWKDVEKRVPWGIIILYGGAITLGLGIEKSGAGSWIADGLFHISGDNLFIVILAMIILTIILTNIMSNIAAVSILLPIGISIASQLQINPLLTSMVIALSGGLAFMFVISTPGNAITYSSGYYSTKDLLKAGFISNIICMLVIFIVAILYWVMVLGLDKIT